MAKGNKIEEIIDNIEEYLDKCKLAPFSKNKILVEREYLDELLTELRLKTPEEVKNCAKIARNKDEILSEAREEADKILHDAKVQTEELINEHEIMKRAILEAEQVKNEAIAEADSIISDAYQKQTDTQVSALDYTDTILAGLQSTIESAIAVNREKYESLVGSLEQQLSTVVANRNELTSIKSRANNDDYYQEKDETDDDLGSYIPGDGDAQGDEDDEYNMQ